MTKKVINNLQDQPEIDGAKPKKRARTWVNFVRGKENSQKKLQKLKEIDWTKTEEGAKLKDELDEAEKIVIKWKTKPITGKKPLEEIKLTPARRRILVLQEVIKDPTISVFEISQKTWIPIETVRDIRNGLKEIQMPTIISKYAEDFLELASMGIGLLRERMESDVHRVFMKDADVLAIAEKGIKLYSLLKWENVNPDGGEKKGLVIRFANTPDEAGLSSVVRTEESETTSE